MVLIKRVDVSSTSIRAAATSVSIKVTGDVNAVFSMQVTRSSDNRYYNFTTGTFLAATTSRSRLKNQKPKTINIAIPAAANGDTYTVVITAEPHYSTGLAFGNGYQYTQDITQVADATVTFNVGSFGSQKTTSIGDSTGSVLSKFSSTTSPTIVLKDLLLGITVETEDYGFFITTTNNTTDLNNGTWDSSALYWDTVSTDHETTSGSDHDAGSTSTALVLNNVDGLYVGMSMSAIESGTVTATMPTITAIDTFTLVVTLSAAQTWATTKDITFRAYGTSLIKEAIGIGVSVANSTVRMEEVTTTVRSEVTSDVTAGSAFNVISTQGISKGATIRMRGLDKNLGAACTIATISTPSLTVGAITLTGGTISASAARPIRVGATIHIDGSSDVIYLSGTISISKYPTANQTVYVDTSKILTIGTAT